MDTLFELVRYCCGDGVYFHIQYGFSKNELQGMADWLRIHTGGDYGVRIARGDWEGYAL